MLLQSSQRVGRSRPQAASGWSASLRRLPSSVSEYSTRGGTAEQQGVSPELLSPYFELMRRRLAEGSGEEDLTGVIDLLVR